MGQADLIYIIEAATNLVPASLWQPIGGDTSDGVGVFQFIDTDATNFMRRFYRVRSP